MSATTAAYQDLENLPARAIGELFDGQLHAQSSVGGRLFNPFHFGEGGPGGWVIYKEFSFRHNTANLGTM